MTDEVREALTAELKYWRSRVFDVSDMFPQHIFPANSESREGAAAMMARHVATTIGIWLAARYEALERGEDEASERQN